MDKLSIQDNISNIENLPYETNEELVDFSNDNPNQLMLICFTASWCNPCSTLKEYLNNLINTTDITSKYNISINTVQIDNDDYSELVEEYNVSKIPNLMFFKQGYKIESMLGTKEMDSIPQKIKLYLS
tara:strand:- start:89 stop:472 length:384 start_codon:yes stop_codon:yes gene_type:complete